MKPMQLVGGEPRWGTLATYYEPAPADASPLDRGSPGTKSPLTSSVAQFDRQRPGFGFVLREDSMSRSRLRRREDGTSPSMYPKEQYREPCDLPDCECVGAKRPLQEIEVVHAASSRSSAKPRSAAVAGTDGALMARLAGGALPNSTEWTTRHVPRNAVRGSANTGASYGIGAFGIVETPGLSWKS